MELSFTEEDWKPLENVIARALTRALVSAAHILAKEGLFGLSQQQAEAAPPPVLQVTEPVVERPPAPVVAREHVEEAVERINGMLDRAIVQAREQQPEPVPPTTPDPDEYVPPTPVTDWMPEKEPEFGRHIERPTQKPTQIKPKRRSVRDVVRTVAERPHGYIDTETARRLINLDPAQLGQWIMNRQIEALIVAGVKPPSKGLPGRLMVDKQSLLKRNELREENAKLPAMHRKPAPVINTTVAT